MTALGNKNTYQFKSYSFIYWDTMRFPHTRHQMARLKIAALLSTIPPLFRSIRTEWEKTGLKEWGALVKRHEWGKGKGHLGKNTRLDQRDWANERSKHKDGVKMKEKGNKGHRLWGDLKTASDSEHKRLCGDGRPLRGRPRKLTSKDKYHAQRERLHSSVYVRSRMGRWSHDRQTQSDDINWKQWFKIAKSKMIWVFI